MWKGAVSASLVAAKEPDKQVQVAAGTQREEVLPFRILAVGVFENDFGNLRGIDGIFKIAWVDGIETV